MGNANSGQVAQQKPQTTPEVNVAENNGATAPKPDDVKNLVFAIMEFFLAAFAFCNIVLNPTFMLLGTFIYVSNFLVATLKEVFNFKMDKLFKINLAMASIAGLQMLLIIVLATGYVTPDITNIIIIVLKLLMAFIPMRIVMYATYYGKKLFNSIG